MYFLQKMVVFHCFVSLPEGILILPPLVKNYNNPKESMQLDIFFTYYLKTHRIVLAQNGRKKKRTSSHGSNDDDDDDDDDGKWKIFPHFFVGWKWLARWC